MTQVRGNQLKNQSVTKTQIGNKEITTQQIGDGAVTDQQVSLTAGIQQSKIDGLVTALANKLDKDGSSPATGPVVLAGDPVNPLDATPKQYVDKVAAGSKALLLKNFNLLDDSINPLHAPFTTTDLGTQTTPVFDNAQNFITAGHSNYSVFTTTVAVDTGSAQFLYQLGGSQGTLSTQIRNVSRTTLSNTGSQSTWVSAGVVDIPENATSTGKADVLTTGTGKHIVFAKGQGDNLLWRSQAINNTTGDFAGWDILSPLPINTGDPDVVILTVNSIQTGYILANNTGGSSQLIMADFDVNGDVSNYTVTSIPQSIIGKLIALNNNYLYIFGTGLDSNKAFIGTINQTTRAVTWTTTTTTIPAGLTKFGVSIHTAGVSNNQVYIYGGSFNGALQDTIYCTSIDGGTGALGTFNPITAKLESSTAGMGLSSITIGTKTFVYATGGQRTSGFIDNSTFKELIASRTFHNIKRTIGAGLFYHVNKTSESRPQQDLTFSPDINMDSTLSKPINVFYFARKDNTHLDYVSTTSVDPALPEDISDNEHLLIRMDQIDPLTGDVISLAIATSPVQFNDYLSFQPSINQIFTVDETLISTGSGSINFSAGAFTIGNLNHAFGTSAQNLTGLTNNYIYWSNFEIISTTTIQENQILLGKYSSGTFTPSPVGTSLIDNTNRVIAANSTLTYPHLFNSDNLSVQVWIDDGGKALNNILKITQTDLNTIQLINPTNNSVIIKQIVIKKEN